MNNLLEFPFSIKSTQEEGIIEGYASVFNVTDEECDVVLPGAFNGTNKENIRFLWQHIPEDPIGKIITMYEDRKGLYIKAQLILSVTRAHEAYMLLKSGVLNGLSIGYIPVSYSQSKLQAGPRNLEKIELKEISLVTFPANKYATVTKVKSALTSKNNATIAAIKKAIDILQR